MVRILLSIGKDVDHVGAVLAGAHDPVDLAAPGIIAADGLGRFSSEPDLALHEGQPVRAAQGAKFDLRFRLLTDEVDNRQGVKLAEAVIGHIRRMAIRGGDYFVRIVADGNARDDVQAEGINDGESVVLLGEDQERGFGGRGLCRI